jgi:hypothetical protein
MGATGVSSGQQTDACPAAGSPFLAAKVRGNSAPLVARGTHALTRAPAPAAG